MAGCPDGRSRSERHLPAPDSGQRNSGRCSVDGGPGGSTCDLQIRGPRSGQHGIRDGGRRLHEEHGRPQRDVGARGAERRRRRSQRVARAARRARRGRGGSISLNRRVVEGTGCGPCLGLEGRSGVHIDRITGTVVDRRSDQHGRVRQRSVARSLAMRARFGRDTEGEGRASRKNQEHGREHSCHDLNEPGLSGHGQKRIGQGQKKAVHPKNVPARTRARGCKGYRSGRSSGPADQDQRTLDVSESSRRRRNPLHVKGPRQSGK